MYIYEVVIEQRDNDGDVINNDYVFRTLNREEAIKKAKEYRDKYGTVVIETWQDEDTFIDVTLENQY